MINKGKKTFKISHRRELNKCKRKLIKFLHHDIVACSFIFCVKLWKKRKKETNESHVARNKEVIVVMSQLKDKIAPCLNKEHNLYHD